MKAIRKSDFFVLICVVQWTFVTNHSQKKKPFCLNLDLIQRQEIQGLNLLFLTLQKKLR